MGRLLAILYQFRAAIFFLFLEGIAVVLILSDNPDRRSSFFNSANQVAGSIMATSSSVEDYFMLNAENQRLAKENARLKELLTKQKATLADTVIDDSLSLPSEARLDSSANHIEVTTAEVINNSVRRSRNYLTLNKGKKDDVKPGMAVIGSAGIIGEVKAVSNHYATVISVLHTEVFISSIIKKNDVFCTTRWNGRDPMKAQLLYVPRHINVQSGDTIVTSGYNAVYPKNILIGTVAEVSTPQDASFHDIDVNLVTDFKKLDHVYVIKNNQKAEIDSLRKVSYE